VMLGCRCDRLHRFNGVPNLIEKYANNVVETRL
jgi:hypothetical protein